MTTTERVKLAREMQEYTQAHPNTCTPMRDFFLSRYGADCLTKCTILILWDDWVKVARMAAISDVHRRGSQWTENGVIVREGLNILR